MQYVFARAIRKARVASNLTQLELSGRLGVTRARVSQIESLASGVDELSFLRIAEALQITPPELLGYAYEEVEGG